MFLRLNASLAEPNTATSSAPAARAASRPWIARGVDDARVHPDVCDHVAQLEYTPTLLYLEVWSEDAVCDPAYALDAAHNF
jgi:hypothetical protein